MDFLKTLLAYVTLLATLGVQEGPAPETVPTPTPLPPHVTASPVPHQTAAPTATPGPTAQPGPVITPNKRYSKVEFGDSGTQVRKLQNRLIELGYMPKGSADSKYGYQTYNAVKEFQRNNSLEVDGVAGPITLTYLYENPNVVRTGIAPTEVPTATPTQALPPLATPNVTSSQQITAAVTAAPTQAATAEPTAEPTAVPTAAPTATPEPEITLAVPYPAELVPLENGSIVNGNTGTVLYYRAAVNGKTTQVKPNLWQNEFGAVVASLPQLSDALGWRLTGSGTKYTLRACGYVIDIHYQAGGSDVRVDGDPTYVPEEDVMLHNNTLFVSEGFLRMAMGANTVYDRHENALVLFLKDKSMAGAQD